MTQQATHTEVPYDYRGARDALFKSPIPGPLKLLALALVEFMPECRPSVQTLASRCGVERKTILRALARLERMAVITIERAPGLRSRYAFRPVPTWRTGPAESPVPSVRTGPAMAPVPPTDGTGTNGAPGPVPTRPPTSPKKGPKAVSEADPESRRADPERARPRAVAGALDAVARTVTMPGPEPTESYLASCTMAGVKPAQARSTWSHYFGQGLPPGGVERLEAWLVQRATEKQTKGTTLPARASPRPGDDLDTTGAATAFQPSSEHQDYTKDWLSGETLQSLARKCRAVPRFASLSTAEQDREFLARLRHLKDQGMFFADGPLPKPRAPKEARP